MRAAVVDTNVGIVANGQAPQADAACVAASVAALQEIQDHGLVVIDDGYRILGEYLNYFHPTGQPGAGDRFIQWLLLNQANPTCCEQVHLTPIADLAREFAEFPLDPNLAGFDPADRKWVAIARASRHHPPILNAVDSDWWNHRAALMKHGVRIDCLCPHLQRQRR
jgi:hypothetical protein